MGNGVAGRVTLFVLAGVAAGFLTWLISDGLGVIHLSDTTGVLSGHEARDYQIIFMTWGASVAILLGFADILATGQTAQWTRVLWLGFLVGVASGIIGGQLGMALFGALYASHANTPLDFLRNVLARAIGWGLIGAFAGTAAGWRKLSLRVGRNGFWGGLIGGILGGGMFEIIPYLAPGIGVGAVGRLIGLLITGACIGLFVALVQELFKEAWIRVVVGRNEGKEILVDKGRMTIGRSELSDIALFGDPSIAKSHAVIEARTDGRFVVRDVSQLPIGVRVNEARVDGERVLSSGDVLLIANRQLIFYERMARAPTSPEPRDISPRTPAPSLAPATIPAPVLHAYAPPRREVTATAYLVATSGPYTATAFAVRNGAVAGRDPQAEIALPADTKASRSHARFLQEPGGFVVEDNGSTNGTFVNGQRITRQSLVAGDTVQIGSTAFRFE